MRKGFTFLDSIISQGRENTFRRGVGAKLYGHERDLRYAKKVNNLYKKVFYFPRNTLCNLRNNITNILKIKYYFVNF